MGQNLERGSLLDEIHPFYKGCLFDLGHPLLNRVADTFIKSATIGAVQAVSREAYFSALESGGGNNGGMPTDISAPKRHRRFPDLKGETNKKSVEALVKSTGKESMQWGLAAGMYSGLTYGLREARGVHDWIEEDILQQFGKKLPIKRKSQIENVKVGQEEVILNASQAPPSTTQSPPPRGVMQMVVPVGRGNAAINKSLASILFTSKTKRVNEGRIHSERRKTLCYLVSIESSSSKRWCQWKWS